MTIWIILTVMSSAAAVLVAIPLIRRYEAASGQSAADTGIYRDQLKEIDRDHAQGLIGAGEAELARLEIQRRLLAAAKSVDTARPVSPLWRNVALVATAGFVVLGAVNLYALNGRPDLPAVQRLPPPASAEAVTPALPAKSGSGDVDAMIGKLAAKLAQNPGDAEGWRMLGWSYFNTERYDESATAYAKAMTLAPDQLGYQSAHAEALVQAAGGVVTPKAQAFFAAVLQKDSKEERSRFYMALAREQAGDLSSALDMWIALLGDAPQDAGWLVDVRQRIAELGAKTGREVTEVLAASPALAPGADTSLAASEKQAAVDAMIAKLAAKLEANPVDRDGWAMMIRSLTVKGDVPAAERALSSALAAFKGDPATRSQIAGLAQSLGVAVSGTAAAAAPVVTQDDIAAASAMPAEDQQAMIRSMVERLSGKLAASPHDAEGWLRLIRSRMVLKEPDLAREALARAMAEFAGDAKASGEISAAARELGVTLQ